jgi:hypothetical protein
VAIRWLISDTHPKVVVQEKVRYLAHILDKEREPSGQKISFLSRSVLKKASSLGRMHVPSYCVER